MTGTWTLLPRILFGNIIDLSILVPGRVIAEETLFVRCDGLKSKIICLAHILYFFKSVVVLNSGRYGKKYVEESQPEFPI